MNKIKYWLAWKMLGVCIWSIVYTDGTEQITNSIGAAFDAAVQYTRNARCMGYVINPAGDTVAIFSHGFYME